MKIEIMWKSASTRLTNISIDNLAIRNYNVLCSLLAVNNAFCSLLKKPFYIQVKFIYYDQTSVVCIDKFLYYLTEPGH